MIFLNNKLCRSTLITLMLFLFSFYAQAQISPTNNIVYVTPNGSGNGHDWAHATSDLQGAIDATGNPDNGKLKVFVAIGEYKVPGNNSFVMKENVEIYGGFDPQSGITDLTHRRILPNQGMGAGSILDGKGERPVIWNYNNHLSAGALLDGFTITNGYLATNGGGIVNYNSSPSLNNLVVENNRAGNGAGGIFSDHSSSRISNLIIRNNTATKGGGAGSVNASPVFTNVLFSSNAGGALLNDGLGTTLLTNVTIVDHNSTAVVVNAGSLTVHNSIIWGGLTGTYTASYSLIEGKTGGTGNLNGNTITAAEIFSDFAGGHYHLLKSSPAVNAGSNEQYWNAAGDGAIPSPTPTAVWGTDLEGRQRLSGVSIDLGAYEYQTIVPMQAKQFMFGNIIPAMVVVGKMPPEICMGLLKPPAQKKYLLPPETTR